MGIEKIFPISPTRKYFKSCSYKYTGYSSSVQQENVSQDFFEERSGVVMESRKVEMSTFYEMTVCIT
jgi:hypothetical protein